AVYVPGLVENFALVHDLSRAVQHRPTGQIVDPVPCITLALLDKLMIRVGPELVLMKRRQRDNVRHTPASAGGVANIVKQEEVLDTFIVEKLDALVLRDRSPTVHVEPVKNPTFRHGYWLGGPIIDHDLDGPLGELVFHLLDGLRQEVWSIERR